MGNPQDMSLMIKLGPQGGGRKLCFEGLFHIRACFRSNISDAIARVRYAHKEANIEHILLV